MDTTTPDAGATIVAEPTQTSEAVQDSNEQVIVQDENGTPSLAPTSQAQSASEAVSDEQTTETQAEDDVQTWAEKKGLPLDDPVKLAKMYRDAEKRMHEATEAARQLETTVVQQGTVDYTGDANYDALAQTVNQLAVQNSVREFFAANPSAREFEPKMAEIVMQRPHLKGDLDALYALARNDPNRETELKQAGGREALENLAQKQQAIPPNASVSSGLASTPKITPQNVDQLVAQHDNEWFKQNYEEIKVAMAG